MSEIIDGTPLSDADLRSRGRSILYQPETTTDRALASQQREILSEWVRRRTGRHLEPHEWVELGIARRLIQELDHIR